MRKIIVYTFVALFSIGLHGGVWAEIQTFTGTSRILSRSSYIQEELRVLTKLEAARKCLEQAAAYAETLPAVKASNIKKEWLMPFTALVFFDEQGFEPQGVSDGGQTGFEAKVKATMDTDRLPEKVPEFLYKRYQNLEIMRLWLLHRYQMEGTLRQYIVKVEGSSDPVGIQQLKQMEGQPLMAQHTAFELFEKGGHSFERGRFDEAIESLTQSLQQNPSFTVGYFVRGAAYFNKKMYDKALQDFSKTIELSPTDAVFYYARGVIYLKQGILFKAALQDMTKAIELNPAYSDAYYARGAAHAYLKDCDRAEKNFQKACALGTSKACSAQCDRPEAPEQDEDEDERD